MRKIYYWLIKYIRKILLGCKFQHLNAIDQVTWCQTCKTNNKIFECTLPTIYFGNILGGDPVETYGVPEYMCQWCHEMGFQGDSIELGGFTDTGLTWRNNKWDDKGERYGRKITILKCKWAVSNVMAGKWATSRILADELE